MHSPPDSSPPGEEHVYLIIRSSLDDYLSFMTSYPVDAADADRKQLTAEWMAADRAMARLREEEPEWADVGVPWPLPDAVRPLVDRVAADSIFRRAFADADWEVAAVDLDRVVVSQKVVSLRHVRQLQAELGPDPSPEAVFRFCLPFDRVPPPHRASRIGDDEFAFVSESNDLRFLDAVLLRPDQITGFQPAGPIAGVVAVVVGFGSNYLHALAVDGRLILNNGHHRACALHALGVRRAPCVVQKIGHPDELDAHAPRAVRRNPRMYVSDPRPPVLKDYFDPTLARSIRLALTTKQVRVGYSVESKDMP